MNNLNIPGSYAMTFQAHTRRAESAGPVTSTDAIQQHNTFEIKNYLRSSVFNSAELSEADRDRLCTSRAQVLARKGKTQADVMDVLVKGMKEDDRNKEIVGYLRSAPFAMAGALEAGLPQILTLNGRDTRPSTQNILGAALFVATNSIGVGVSRRSTSDTQWMIAKEKDLDPAIARILHDHTPSNMRRGIEGALTVQWFTGKNAGASGIRAAGAGIATAVGSKVEQYGRPLGYTKSGISSAGSMWAGGKMARSQHEIDKREQRVGPQYLLGRNDWEQHFDDLEAYDSVKKAKNVLERVAHLPADVAQDIFASMQAIFTPTGIISDVLILGGGIAANEYVRAAAKSACEAQGLPEPVAALVGDLAAAGGEFLYFGAWAATAAVTKDAAAWANGMIDKFRTRGALEQGDLEEGARLLENGNRVTDPTEPSIQSHLAERSSNPTRVIPRASLNRVEFDV